MSVRTFPTIFLPEMFGIVIDMPTPDLYVVKTSKGEYSFHADEIREIFYN